MPIAAPYEQARPTQPRATPWALAALAVLAAMLALIVLWKASGQRAEVASLLHLPADQVPTHAALVAFADARAPAVFAAACAACHGADARGNTTIGAPNLRDGKWLYGTGRVSDIERSILYGIRVGGKSRNVAEMPAFGLTGLLSRDQIRQLVTYVLTLNGRSGDATDAALGAALYADKGGCADCHGGDAVGNPDYGAPNLTDNAFPNGASPDALFDSIYSGRHNEMPGYVGTLSLAQIRALAVWLHGLAPPPPAPPSGPRGQAS